MSSIILWSQILERASIKDYEIKTVPIVNVKRTPLWFRVSSDWNVLFIDQAQDNAPSSKLKMPRRMNFEEFDRIYGFFDLRLKGESISQKALSKSVNTVYIYGLGANARSLNTF